MEAKAFTITIHMVSSLDGFIAKQDNSISWLDTTDHYEKGAGEPDMAAFLQTIDCYVMGARTYEHAMELSKNYGWPYGDIPTVVLSNRQLPVEKSNVKLYAGTLQQLVDEQLKPAYNNVWVVGGATVVNAFIRAGLANEIRLTILPILLGEGLKFFEQMSGDRPLHLQNVSAYKNGMVELSYQVIAN